VISKRDMEREGYGRTSKDGRRTEFDGVCWEMIGNWVLSISF